jgi:hypothetical protein
MCVIGNTFFKPDKRRISLVPVSWSIIPTPINKAPLYNEVFPITHIVMLLSALSMAGIPFLNGFLSKEMFFDGFHKPM